LDPSTSVEIASSLTRLRAAAPLVQCITNTVVQNFVANVLLASGASPAMVQTPEESGDFAAIANALTVNLGTLNPNVAAGAVAAVRGAKASGRPWVLDPVAHFATPYRARINADLLAQRPTILRGNASEIMAFAGQASAGRGVDAGDGVEAAMPAARLLARRIGGVVLVSGPRDFVTDGARAALVSGGSALMPRVTGTGCAMTGLLGAHAAVTDPFTACLATAVHFALAGERAAVEAAGPGSFVPAFIDALAAVQPAEISMERIEWL